MPFLLLLGAIFLLARTSSSSSDAPSAGGGGDDALYMTCEQAIEHLPESMRLAVAMAIYKGTDAKALLELANALEVAASSQTDPYLRAALLVASHCARDRAVAISSGAPLPSPSLPPSTPPATTTAASSASSSSLASGTDGTAPASTADGSAPIFDRVDATTSNARVARTYTEDTTIGIGERKL